jgi:hypothetical protein
MHEEGTQILDGTTSADLSLRPYSESIETGMMDNGQGELVD